MLNRSPGQFSGGLAHIYKRVIYLWVYCATDSDGYIHIIHRRCWVQQVRMHYGSGTVDRIAATGGLMQPRASFFGCCLLPEKFNDCPIILLCLTRVAAAPLPLVCLCAYMYVSKYHLMDSSHTLPWWLGFLISGATLQAPDAPLL